MKIRGRWSQKKIENCIVVMFFRTLIFVCFLCMLSKNETLLYLCMTSCICLYFLWNMIYNKHFSNYMKSKRSYVNFPCFVCAESALPFKYMYIYKTTCRLLLVLRYAFISLLCKIFNCNTTDSCCSVLAFLVSNNFAQLYSRFVFFSSKFSQQKNFKIFHVICKTILMFWYSTLIFSMPCQFIPVSMAAQVFLLLFTSRKRSIFIHESFTKSFNSRSLSKPPRIALIVAPKLVCVFSLFAHNKNTCQAVMDAYDIVHSCHIPRINNKQMLEQSTVQLYFLLNSPFCNYLSYG